MLWTDFRHEKGLTFFVWLGCRFNKCRWERQLGRLQHMMQGGDERAEQQFNQYLQFKYALEVQVGEPEFLKDALTFAVGAASWLKEQIQSEGAAAFCAHCPEHLPDDLLEMLQYISRASPATLATCQLEELFDFCVLVLSLPDLIHSPHLRAKFGDVLHMVFLPHEERGDHGVPPPPGSSVYTNFLLSRSNAQETLAPSLLLLYGDVEHTGFYDKLEHRWRIAAILKYLWKSPEHR